MEATPTPAKSRKVYFIVAGVIVLLVVLVLVIFRFTPRQNGQGNGQANKQDSGSDQSGQMAEYTKGCKNQPVAFTFSPLAVSDIGYIQPLGLMTDGHVTPVDHIYIAPKDSNAAEGSYSVAMPADGRVLAVQSMPAQYIGDKTGMTRAPDDYRLVVRFSCRYLSIFIHLHELAPALKAAVGALQPGENSRPIDIPIQAGELLAKLGSRPFDWTMVDLRTTLTGFITPALYNGEPWKIHSIDPISVYAGDLKTQLEALNLRSEPPLGGKIDNDVKGALIGNWFRVGSGGYSSNNSESSARYYDGHLAVAPNYIDPSSMMVSIGNWQGAAKQFLVKGKVDPASVTAVSGPIKYELLNPDSYTMADGQPWDSNTIPIKPLMLQQNGDVQGTIMFQVLAGEKLKVETFPGKKASAVSDFTSAAKMYER